MRLILMRHAKSAWDTDAPDDHARPLSARGRRDAPRIAERLLTLGWVPDRALSSDSTRTRETWARMRGSWDEEIPITWDHRLYHADPRTLREVIAEEPGAETLLVIGHNPGLEAALAELCGEYGRMPTASAALLETSAPSWAEATAERGRFELVALLRPRDEAGR